MPLRHSFSMILFIHTILITFGVLAQKFTSLGDFSAILTEVFILGYMYWLGIIFHSYPFSIQENPNTLFHEVQTALVIHSAKELPKLHFWITPNSSSLLFFLAMPCLWLWFTISVVIDTLLSVNTSYFLLIMLIIGLVFFTVILFFVYKKQLPSLNLYQQEFLEITPECLHCYYKGSDTILKWRDIKDMYFSDSVNPPRLACIITIQEGKDFPVFSLNLLDIKFKASDTIMDKILTHYWLLNKKNTPSA